MINAHLFVHDSKRFLGFWLVSNVLRPFKTSIVKISKTVICIIEITRIFVEISVNRTRNRIISSERQEFSFNYRK